MGISAYYYAIITDLLVDILLQTLCLQAGIPAVAPRALQCHCCKIGTLHSIVIHLHNRSKSFSAHLDAAKSIA